MAFVSERETTEKMKTVMQLYPVFRNNLIKRAKFSYVKNEISLRQFHIMFCLKSSKYRTITELAKFMGISKSTLSIIIGKMIKKDYVIKTFPDDITDKRKVYFELSPKGLEIFNKIKKAEMEEFEYMFSVFSDKGKDDLKTAFENLSKIVKNKSSDFFDMISNEYSNYMAKVVNNYFLFLMDFVRENKTMTPEGISENITSLTKNQVSLLIYIEVFKYNTVSKLENFLNSSGSTVSITISKLVKNGYLFKEYPKDGDDGRIVLIKLTQKGRETLRDVEKIVTKKINDYICSLDQEEIKNLDTSLDCLLDALNEVKKTASN